MHMKFFLQKSSQTVDIMQDVCYYIGRGKVFLQFFCHLQDAVKASCKK